MYIYNSLWAGFLSLGRSKGGGAITLFPFIFLDEILLRYDKVERNKIVRNHEKIHFWQQLEMLIIPFYIVYAINYIINRFRFKVERDAYVNIIFEKEAYIHEANPDYLKRRKIFGWLR